MQAGTTRVGDRLVLDDTQREVCLDEFVRDVGKTRPQRVTIRTVAHGAPRDASEANLEQLEPLAILIVSRVKQVRAIREASRIHRIRCTLTEHAAHDIEDTTQRVGAARKSSREFRLQQAAIRYSYVDELVEAVIEENVRIEQVYRERAKEHFEHFFIHVEIDRALGLRVRAFEVENCHIAFAPQLASDLVRTFADTVVADIVFEVLRLLRHDHVNDRAHRFEVTIEHYLHRLLEHVITETLGDFDATLGRRSTGRNKRIEVEAVPLRRAYVVQNQFE